MTIFSKFSRIPRSDFSQNALSKARPSAQTSSQMEITSCKNTLNAVFNSSARVYIEISRARSIFFQDLKK